MSIKSITLAFLILVVFISAKAQDCEKEISTNPVNPYNNHPFPFNRYNPWLNTGFNIGETENGNVPTMELNDQITWLIPDVPSNNLPDMINPYKSTGTTGDRYNYLHPTNVDFEYLDYKWEDGWEVLYIGLGFYPNGEEIQVASTQRAYSLAYNQPSNPRVPYIILYNRYRGTLRVFMNLFKAFDGYSTIRAQLSFDDNSQSGLSGILRHLEPFDRALDQTTNVKRQESHNPNSGAINRWFSADFQMGYDPCICGKNQKWKISLRGMEIFSVQLYGRGIDVLLPISDGSGNPNYDVDWLSSNGLTDGLSGGNQIFTHMEALVEDYKNALDLYEQNSEEYADYLEKKAVLNAFKGFIVDGVSGLIPGSGSFKSWFVEPKKKESNFANYIKGASKGLFGYGYDQLSMSINPKTTAPKAPDMPTASYSEMRFKGTITGTSQEETVGPFFIPGSYDETSALSNLDPFNYPAYNAPVGIAALLNTPTPTVYFDSQLNELTNSGPPDPCNDCNQVQITYETESDFRLRFEDEFVISLNPSLDYDMDRTASYVQIEVILENDLSSDEAGELQSFENALVYGSSISNLVFERYIQDDAHQRKVYQSEWVLLEELNQYDFALNPKHQLSVIQSFNSIWAFPAPCQTACIHNNPLSFNLSEVKFELANVKMKILHDYYFEQIGSSGEQVNTTQVFAYELYNKKEGINLLGNQSDFQNNLSNFGEYITGVMFLGNEIITPTHPLVHEVIGNDIFVNGQDIVIGGNFPALQPGFYPHNLTIQAQEQIHLIPGAHLYPAGAGPTSKTHLRIKKDFYDTPVFEYADNDAVAAFCNNTDAYQANSPSAALRRRIEEAAAAQELDDLSKSKATSSTSLSLYPNPARSELTIQTHGAGIDRLTIFDTATRPVMQASPGGASLYRMDISGLAQGVYIVRVECGGEVLTEKLVVAK